MPGSRDQLALFGEPPGAALAADARLPEGWAYRIDFIDAGEEGALLNAIGAARAARGGLQRLHGATSRCRLRQQLRLRQRRARRRAAAADFLEPLQAKAAAWIGEPAGSLVSALVAEYLPGVPLGWNRDVPDFETVVGVSLAGAARMRFRRYPPVAPKKADVVSLELAPRSAYMLRAEARWGWQHSIASTPALRYSITFRSASARALRHRLSD